MRASRSVAPIACIGKFDALHLGHRELVVRAARLGPVVLLGFRGMAAALGWPARPPLCPPPDRLAVVRSWGVEAEERRLAFAEIRDLAPADFVTRLAATEGCAGVVVGGDFRFGPGRCAGAGDLQRLAAAAGLHGEVVPPVLIDGRKVASSAVREAVLAGDVQGVARLLGRDYRLLGRVEAGARYGRHLGRPTANCGDPANLVPGSGVYAALVRLGEEKPRWSAAVNIGRRPSVATDGEQTVEAHLLDYAGDCYGSAIRIDFHARLRDERRFSGPDELRAQIDRDVAAVRKLVG